MNLDLIQKTNLSGKTVTIDPSKTTRGSIRKLQSINAEFRDKLDAVEDELDEARDSGDEEKQAEVEQKISRMEGEFYREQARIAFDFEDGLPEVEFFASEDYPYGKHIILLSVFTNPSRFLQT